jgi:predicted methyltransferase
MRPPLEVVLEPAAVAPELRTPAALAQEPTVEEPIAEASRIAEAWAIAERRFEGEHLQLAHIMGVAAATAIRIISIAVEAGITVAESIPAALW